MPAGKLTTFGLEAALILNRLQTLAWIQNQIGGEPEDAEQNEKKDEKPASEDESGTIVKFRCVLGACVG